MARPELQLDNQLCFLFHRVGRELNAAYRPLLADLGLTYPQYLTMLVLWERDGLTVGEIGDRLALDSATLSPLLGRLVQTGLVTKSRDPADERRVTVHLTDEGRTLEDRAAAVPAEVAGYLVDGLEDYTAVRGLLTALLERIARTAESAQSR
jgi:DNA-binding MarR family transcriptional regulator